VIVRRTTKARKEQAEQLMQAVLREAFNGELKLALSYVSYLLALIFFNP